MDVEFSYERNGHRIVCRAERRDAFFGHGVEVLRSSEGRRLAAIHLYCSPEREGFEACQQMSTDALVQTAKLRIESGALNETLTAADAAGLTIISLLNGLPVP